VKSFRLGASAQDLGQFDVNKKPDDKDQN